MMSSHNSKRNLDFKLILYYLLAQTIHALCSNSGIYRYPGETSPDRVEMAIGESVNISCHMHPPWFPGKSSADLYFVDGPSQDPVPKENIAIVNDSTIVFMLRNATERQTSYICKIGKEAIMASKVNVGTPPKNVEDFNCRSFDYEYMICNFTQPENPVLTQYNLTFHTYSPDYSYQPVCNYERKLLVVCNITLSQKYTPTAEYFYFTLKAINALGTQTQRFNVNIWNSMILARPGNDIRVIELTTDRLQVAWKMPKYSDKLKSLQWEIMLKPDGPDGSPWLNMSNLPVLRAKSEVRLRLNELPYAYFRYVLKLRVCVRSANDPDTMWSEPFFYRFRTIAKRPDEPPRTDAGSFYVDATETQVCLYWEQLSEYKQNGANLTYHITEVKKDGRLTQQQPLQLDLNSAVFSWQKDAHYEFFIKSRNHIGESLASSRIEIVPLIKRNYTKHIPRPIHNVYHAADRTYTLTWEPPESREDLLDYSVYWCYSKRALQNECKGSIHFKRIDKKDTKFTTDPQSIKEEHTLNMAVSANYLNYNTGMHWTPCTVDINSDLVKMAPEIQTSSAFSIRVQWSPESVCPSILEGYNLTYCEVGNGSGTYPDPLTTAGCLNPARIMIISKNLKQFEINELKPYTYYKLEMFMYSRKKMGKSSDPLVVRTTEAAPSPPRQLSVSKITNTSATISWLSPSQPNGKIRYYVVILNNEKHRVAAPNDSSDPEAKLVFEFQNLVSFTAYKAYIVAHTVDSSDPSNDIHFTTLIGYPSMPSNVIIKDNYNSTIIQWSKPLKPAGRVDFYEVAVIVKRNDELVRKHITIVSRATSCALQIPACIGHEYKTVFEVRAVNAALKTHEVISDYTSSGWDIDEAYEGNEDLRCFGKDQQEFKQYRNSAVHVFFKSPWQPGPTYGCSATRLSKITTIAVMVIVLSLCFMAPLYFARKKYNKMANIDCTLPHGLDSYPTKSSDDNETREKTDRMGPYRSKELIFHNEKHHLLSSLGNDSGYLGDGRLANSNLAVTDGAQMPEYLRNTSESSVDSLVESTVGSIELDMADGSDQLSIGNTRTVNTAAPHANENFSMSVLPLSTCYIKPSKQINWSLSEEVPTTSRNGGGYISVGSIALPPPVNTDYVQPHVSQKNMQRTEDCSNPDNAPSNPNNGYTTFDDLGKQSTATQPHHEPIGVVENANTVISGYVTQRDLTAFGQQHLN